MSKTFLGGLDVQQTTVSYSGPSCSGSQLSIPSLVHPAAIGLLHISMDNRFRQSSPPGKSTKIPLPDRNTFLVLLEAIPTMLVHYSPIASGPSHVHYSSIMYLDTAMEPRIRHRSWPCKANNVRHRDGDIVLGVLEAIQIVKVPPYADSDNQNRTCHL